MKITLKFALSTLAFSLIAATPLVRAEDNTVTVPIAPAASSAPAKQGKGGAKGLRDQVVQRDKMLAEKLHLTEEQTQQLAALRKDQAGQLKAVRGDRAKMAEVAKGAPAQVRALLTPDQQKEFDAMKPDGRMARKGKKAGKL